ncbi:MAG: cytochrome b5 domain-containing protein [Candidatus Muiribacteriota bacterium]
MVSKNMILIMVLGVLLIGGCATNNIEKNSHVDGKIVDYDNNQEKSAEITSEMVSEHDSTDDCWVIVDNSVYDISSLISNHQANKISLEACGRSMDILMLKEELEFDNIQKARGRLQDYYKAPLSS